MLNSYLFPIMPEEPCRLTAFKGVLPPVPSSHHLTFGNQSDIELAQMGQLYYEGKVGYSLLIERDNESVFTSFPCAECGYTVHLSAPKKEGVKGVLKAKNTLKCAKCGQKHKIIKYKKMVKKHVQKEKSH